MEIALIALLAASVLINVLVLRGRFAKPAINPPGTRFITERMAAVGELEVFRVVTKEIAHEIGDSGRFWSGKKMLIIYNLEIDGNYILDIGCEQDHPYPRQGGGDRCVRVGVSSRGEVRHV
jgi:hypothetical protein